jgi:hypothetical protein
VADTLEFLSNLMTTDHVAVREMPEVELDRGLKAPLQGDFIDRDGSFSLIVSWCV